jgi:hypothetical protein
MCSTPFRSHPDLRELVGKFKENDGFQQESAWRYPTDGKWLLLDLWYL